MADKPEPQHRMTVEEEIRLAAFLSKGKEGKDPVKETLQKGMRALADAKKYDEIARLMRFAEEMGSKFLATLGENRFKTKDPFKILEILHSERPDWKEIVKRLNASKTYEVMRRAGDKPARIKFTYGNGKVEEYSLEWSGQQHVEFADTVGSILGKKKTNKDKAKSVFDKKEIEDVVDSLSVHPVNAESAAIFMEGFKEMKKVYEESQGNAMADVIERSKRIKTPNDAYEELANSTEHLSDDLMNELSKPLSQMAALIAKLNPNTDSSLNPDDATKHGKYERQVVAIIDKYYPGFSKGTCENITIEETRDIGIIIQKFGLT